MSAGMIHVPWYATGFRGDDLEYALAQITPLSLRYGGLSYMVYRLRDDRYRMLQIIEFEHKGDWDRFWYGDEFVDMRGQCSGWYQVPLLYTWADLTTSASMPGATMPGLAGLGPQ
jgi:hypothetical protein